MPEPVSSYFAARGRALLAVLIVAVGGLFGYSLHERGAVNRLSAENDQVVSLLKDTRAQMSSLSSKLDAMSAAPQPQENGKPSAGHVETGAVAHRSSVSKHRPASESRLTRIQTQLDAQGKEIQSTREELAGARTDLEGSIARTHSELVVLQKKGERNYSEFDLDKNKQFERIGLVGISLRKASTKDMFADLKLRVDDAEISKKHVNLFEPVFFYLGDDHRPVELVINSIRKNHIHGYISAPKYTATELAAAPADNSNSTTPSGQSTQDSTNQQRRKLEVPR